jgi:translation initiation factor 1
MEQQLVRVRLETRKWGKATTVIEGIDAKSVNLQDLGAKLKTSCACGGTAKDGLIILQGDHRKRVKGLLVQFGFPEASIEIH